MLTLKAVNTEQLGETQGRVESGQASEFRDKALDPNGAGNSKFAVQYLSKRSNKFCLKVITRL